jgi:hypothetical protein
MIPTQLDQGDAQSQEKQPKEQWSFRNPQALDQHKPGLQDDHDSNYLGQTIERKRPSSRAERKTWGVRTD